MKTQSFKYTFALLGASLALFSAKVHAEGFRPGTIEIGPMVGYSVLGDYGAELPDSALYYGLRTGVFMTPHVSFEPTYHYLKSENTAGLDVTQQVARFNLTYNFLTGAMINPLISGGLGWHRYKSDSPQDSQDLGVNAGVGLRVKFSESFNARVDARYEYVETLFSEREYNYDAALSLNYVMGASAPKDSDSDGVKDKKDACSGTPKGASVNEKGCPSDEDNDGVFDGIDQCSKTFAGFKVDDKGCPMDTDQDNVPDGPDQCPETPKGAPVDSKGCPKDQDKDNVADYLDQCPDTAEGTQVNEKGCPLDSDLDGVLDPVDLCPNTKPETKVDDKGCPLVIKSKGILKGVNFFSGKAELTPDSLRILDDVANELVEFPKVRVEVQGHTDSVGADAINMKVSAQRAEAVVAYLVSKGIEPSRLVAKGYGESAPIDSNKTKNGRAKNRRVQLKWLDQ